MRVRQALKAGGIACLVVALCILARPLSVPGSTPTVTEWFFGRAVAFAQEVRPIGPLPETLPTLAPSPSPVPAPLQNGLPPQGSSAPSVVRGGPVTVALTGTIGLAKRYASGLTQTNPGESDFGGILEIARRTANTAARIDLPTAVSSSGSRSALGQMSVEYDTARSSFLFGPQPLAPLGLVPLGQTVRGPAMLYPLSHGADILVYQGSTASGATEAFRILGGRLRMPTRGGAAAFSFYDASAKSGGRIAGLVFDYAATGAHRSLTFEGAATRNIGVPGYDDGLGTALAGQYDLFTKNGGQTTLVIRDFAKNFVALAGANAAATADRFAEIGLRRPVPRGSIAVSVSQEALSGATNQADLRRDVSVSQRLGRQTDVALAFDDDRSVAFDGPHWNGTGTLSMTAQVGRYASQFQLGLTKQTGIGQDPTAGITYGAGLARQLGTTAFLVNYTYARQGGGLLGISTSDTTSLSASHDFAKTGVITQLAFSHSSVPGQRTASFLPQLSIVRRLGPVFTLTLQATGQFQRDNTAQGQHSVQIGVNLGAPFTFGNGVATGRVNPRLPASIVGTVVVANANTLVNPLVGNAGLGGIGVVLDGSRTVRTDSLGRFQFQFVQPGRHSVELDPATLPRGLTADVPIVSLLIGGGQQVQTNLLLSSFSEVDGVVTGTDPNGPVPVVDATVVLDGKLRTTTNGQGRFAFGHLLPGAHAVVIDQSSLPATIQLDNLTAAVEVGAAERRRVEFVGKPLGSVRGSLRYDSSGDPGENGKPVLNAYIVANPGDRAAIVDDNGDYILDNMPAGTYTLTVDEETLPDDRGVVSNTPLNVTLAAGGSVTDANFTIGQKLRAVVFSFSGGKTNVISAFVRDHPFPAGSEAHIRVTTSETSKRVTARAFGTTSLLAAENDGGKHWAGELRIPAGTPAGRYDYTVHAEGAAHGDGGGTIRVDPTLALIRLITQPKLPHKAQYAHVFLYEQAGLHAGDLIIWADGKRTVLPPSKARGLFVFDVRVGEVPYRGMVISGGDQYPVSIGS